MAIWRWVELPIQAESAEFVQGLLAQHAPKVRAFPGCQALYLYVGEGPTFYSFSEWATSTDLEAYRQSPLFRTFWAQLRPHFRARPRAFSLTLLARY
ncbi:MAG: antibiotic biosynthesis monooxygenase [Bacteroidia bacterium]|nr:antibiotic biosynthesis monooxygenase [Bacteroidia bacterium]MDW8089091.1 antibiotic biosynthesis monooxygenase family protein [Bacteroidia bacterium]